MAITKIPEADKMLARLLALSDTDLRQVLTIAVEYADHPSIKGVKVGDRLMRQIEFGLNQFEFTKEVQDRD